jgi:hypothetical protein
VRRGDDEQSSSTDSSDIYQYLAAKSRPAVSQHSPFVGWLPIAVDHALNGLEILFVEEAASTKSASIRPGSLALSS